MRTGTETINVNNDITREEIITLYEQQTESSHDYSGKDTWNRSINHQHPKTSKDIEIDSTQLFNLKQIICIISINKEPK